jgi:hypothetical protein
MKRTNSKATIVEVYPNKKAKVLQKGRSVSGAREVYGTVARTRGVYGQGEMKYYDTRFLGPIPISANWTGTEIDPTASVEGTPVATPLGLVQPVQGAAINQRIGREINLFKLKIRGVINLTSFTDQADFLAPMLVRLLLVQDQQTNASQAQGEQVMDNSTDANGYALAFQNLSNFGRFRVLKDKVMVFGPPQYGAGDLAAGAQTTFGNAVGRSFKINYNFKEPVKIRFNATNAGTVADVIDNSFHLFCNAGVNPTTGSDQQGYIIYRCRACYKEWELPWTLFNLSIKLNKEI